MKLISRLFGRSSTSTSPWTEESIYRFICTHVDPKTGALDSRYLDLPDEPAKSASTLRWAPGALDGVMGHHGGKDEDSAVSRKIAKALERVAKAGDAHAVADAYALLKQDAVLASIDEVIQFLSKRKVPVHPHLNEFAVRLATKSADRGPVKAGIALLGAMKLREHEAMVTTLGSHDEFTLFSATALKNMLEEPALALWRLAKNVDGWGRIQIVERLVPTDNEEIRRWLRTEGFRNSVMYEYLALTAAVHGRLHAALEEKEVSADELVAAGEIIRSMIAADDGPGGGLNEYTDAGVACLAYLTHLRSAIPDLRNLLASRAILEYVTEDSRGEAERLKCGWSESVASSVRACANQVIERSEWRALIEQQLDSEDDVAFWVASRAASENGVDAFQWHWKRAQASRRDSSRWHNLMQATSDERIDQVLALAEQSVPLEEIATGAADEMGLGKDFELHSCLDSVLQELRRFPGKGVQFILAGLRSPVVRNRNMALAALQTWDRRDWTPDVLPALQRAADVEMDDRVAERVRELLVG